MIWEPEMNHRGARAIEHDLAVCIADVATISKVGERDYENGVSPLIFVRLRGDSTPIAILYDTVAARDDEFVELIRLVGQHDRDATRALLQQGLWEEEL